MKHLQRLCAVLLLAVAAPVLAQEDISGVWSGMLPVGPDTTLEIHFVLTRAADGTYSALLTSPNPGGIQDIPADSASFEGGRLALTVDALSGRYEGTLGNGAIAGSWFQLGEAIPLELVPYVERVLSDEAKATLRGSWVGELSVQALTLSIVFRFEDNEAGEFVGFLDSPDQGASGIPLANVQLEDGSLSFEIPQAVAAYTGTLSGDSIGGTFTQGGQPLELNVSRGEYQARSLALSQDAVDRLEGSWVGRVPNGQGGTLAIVFRFEASADGGLSAFLDSPEQGASGIPIGELQLEGDQLSLIIAAAQANYTGTLSANEISGNWAQGNLSAAVTMSRGEYVPTVSALDLSDEAMQQLAGTWRGMMGPLDIIVRFETNENGDKLAFLDVPAQGATGLAIGEVELVADQITLVIAAVGATVSGTLAGDEIQASWAQGQANNPLTLARDPR